MSARRSQRRQDRTTASVAATATVCGVRLETRGLPIVRNDGELVLGDDVLISALPALTHLVNAAQGRLVVGDRVAIGHGVAISCHEQVVIEDDAVIGPFVAVMDSDFHAVGSSEPPRPRPVTIERGARLGARTIVLPGAHIGAGATVRAGSVVSGTVPAGAHVAGNPAMPIAENNAVPRNDDAAALVQRVFYLDAPPAPHDGPHSISGWDSLGALELLVELESVLGRPLSENDIAALGSVADVARVLDATAEAPDAQPGETPAAVVARVFGLDVEPDRSARPEDIAGWDSLGTLELVMALEATFGVSIDERRLFDVRCVGDLDELVR